MPNTYQIGRIGRLYMADESSYGTAASLGPGDALRHLNLRFNQKALNRVNSPERHVHPSQINRFTRRRQADWMVSGIVYPSGTLNTVPDMHSILKNTMGAVTNVTLSTTVSASPSPTSTVFTLASVSGLAVGDGLLINATNGGRQVRRITNIASSEVTVAPALSAAPTAGDTVKGVISYKLTTALGPSSNMAHYLSDISYEMLGCAHESLRLTFDANNEVEFEASGPAQKRLRPAQSDPSTFTVVGSTPPSGLTGFLRVDGAAEEFLRAVIEIKNGISLDNVAFGTSQAQAMYRAGKREVLVTIDTMLSSDTTLLDNADTATGQSMLLQCGLTEGSIIAVAAPVLELEEPDDANASEAMQRSFRGVARGTNGNDEVYIYFA